MSFFVDRFNRRKSTLALAAFGAALLDLTIFGLLYAVLAEPLYHFISLGQPAATLAAHALIIAVLGTALCCLLFLLKDKRIAPYGFLGLGILLLLFYAAAFLLDAEVRPMMLYLITIYGLAPVLVGNAAAWPIYLKIKRTHPALNHRKTLAEELQEAGDKEKAKNAKTASQPAPPQPKPDTAAEAEFGPQEALFSAAARSAQEEAALLYGDGEEEEDRIH